MSLVHEALQKAEREKLRKTGGPIALPPQPLPFAAAPLPARAPVISPGAEPPPAAPARLTALLVGVAVLCLVAVVYLVSQAAPAVRDTRPPVQAAVTAAPAAPTAPAAGTPAETRTPAEPAPPGADSGFKLTGIMRDPSSGKYGAVLNGRIVFETHYVDGAIVKRIERDRVTLEVQGRDVVLRLF